MYLIKVIFPWVDFHFVLILPRRFGVYWRRQGCWGVNTRAKVKSLFQWFVPSWRTWINQGYKYCSIPCVVCLNKHTKHNPHKGYLVYTYCSLENWQIIIMIRHHSVLLGWRVALPHNKKGPQFESWLNYVEFVVLVMSARILSKCTGFLLRIASRYECGCEGVKMMCLHPVMDW